MVAGRRNTFCEALGRLYCRKALGFVLVVYSGGTMLVAGPPFKTDDPQPVDYGHWEFYLASEQEFDPDATAATCPHVEMNFGAAPDVQAHIVLPMGYAHSIEGTHYGFSDIEVGVKFRFIQETESAPQVGMFPLVELPTGNKDKQLGQGSVQLFVPLWLQKSWGSLTSYGGGGLWIVPGAKNWLFGGWLLQYDFSTVFTLGGEIYLHSSESPGESAGGGFSIGGYVNIGEQHHILFSVGRDHRGVGAFTGYVGYQLTI